MINEEKLKDFLEYVLVWTEISSKPDVMKLLEKKLNEIFEEPESRLDEWGNKFIERLIDKPKDLDEEFTEEEIFTKNKWRK